MFGIGWAEFFVIILVAILVIPAEQWPTVARFIAKCVKVVRDLIWKISDASEQIKEQIELEKPINDLIKNTTDDMISNFSSIRESVKKNVAKPKKTINKKSKGSKK